MVMVAIGAEWAAVVAALRFIGRSFLCCHQLEFSTLLVENKALCQPYWRKALRSTNELYKSEERAHWCNWSDVHKQDHQFPRVIKPGQDLLSGQSLVLTETRRGRWSNVSIIATTGKSSVPGGEKYFSISSHKTECSRRFSLLPTHKPFQLFPSWCK